VKQYFRFTVDKLKGKRTTHSVTLAAKPHPHLHESEEYIVRDDYTFVDEVVVGDWFHLEAMNRKEWWINIAGVTVWVTLRKDGSVKEVRTYEAGDYDTKRDGVRYVAGEQ